MEAQRIRTIVNLYAELKAKGEQFKDVEPCFVEGNSNLTRLWTTQTFSGASGGNENPFAIDIPVVGTGTTSQGTGEGKGKGRGGDEQGGEGGDGQGGEGGDGQGGEGQGQGQGGEGQGGENGGEGQGGENGGENGGEGQGGENGGDEHPTDENGGDEGGQPQPPPPTQEPEFPNEPQENISEYKMKFPFITEMIYGVKLCNTSNEQESKSIERRLFVGIGIAICRSIMADAGRFGESILASKKDAYRGIFDMLMVLCVRRNEYDAEGNLLLVNDIEDEQALRQLILADNFMLKTLPILTVLNKDLFNEKQVDNAIDFCMARFDEKDSVLVSEKYTDEMVDSVWGLILWRGTDKRNYKTYYYKYSAKIENGKLKKSFDKIDVTSVTKGNLDFSIDLDAMGDEFYKFIWALVSNYLNNNTQDIEQQFFKYKSKKNIILDSATNILSETITYVERLV